MRKCWNCGQPTNNDNSRVCSDEICQRAEKKSSNGEFKHRAAVEFYEREVGRKREYAQRPEVKKRKAEYAREYHRRPERKAKAREYNARPEVKEQRREYRRRPERKAKRREYQRRPEVKAKKREYNRKYLRKKKLREEEWFLLDEQVNQLRSTESGDTPWLRRTYELYNT